jgi:hypothetical protein
MQEDDQLFLGESESHMEKEQIEIMAKVNKITPLVKWLGAASGALILVIAGLAVYQGIAAGAVISGFHLVLAGRFEVRIRG